MYVYLPELDRLVTNTPFFSAMDLGMPPLRRAFVVET